MKWKLYIFRYIANMVKPTLVNIVMLIGVPLLLTHIFVGYLLKPGYCGFIDNGALAPSPQTFLEIITRKDAWWFAPGFSIQTLIYTIVKDGVLAWKLSIYANHVIAFFVAYHAFKRLYVKFFLKENRCKAWSFKDIGSLVTYVLALGYPFTEFIKESGRNYFLAQFTTPYLFEPLYLVLIFELLYELFRIKSSQSLRKFIRGTFPKYLALLALVGFFVGSNPPVVVSNALFVTIIAMFLLLHHLVEKGFKGSMLLVFLTLLLATILIIVVSNIVFILNVFILGSSEIFSEFGTAKRVLWSEVTIVGVLTASRPELPMNTQYAIVTRQQVVLESPLMFYLPLTTFFYVFALMIWPKVRKDLPIEKSRFLTLIFLGIITNVCALTLFMHGETSGDMISEILRNFIKPLTPAFIYNSFTNSTTNLVAIFTYYYLGFVLSLMSFIVREETAKQKELMKKYIVIFCIIVVLLPINIHYYMIQQTYSLIINPTEVPDDYAMLFNFIKNHTNSTYLWIPRYGLIEWRGVFMSDIPLYLGSYYNVDYDFLLSHFVSGDEYYKLLKLIYDGKFKPEDFKDGMVIIEKKYRMINQEFYDRVRLIIENSPYFIRILDYDNVALYKVREVTGLN